MLDQYDPAERGFDAFGNPITGQRNDGDLPSHYLATPERYRLFVDGTRVDYYYSSVSQDSLEEDRVGDEDMYVLTPDADQTVRFETAHRFRYLVGYEAEATLAVGTNQALQGNDEVRVYVGLDDGYEFTFTANDATIKQLRDGVVASSRTVPTAVALTIFSRLIIRYNWYNVGRDRFSRTFSRNGKQFNPALGSISSDDARGPIDANPRIGCEVTTDASTTGLEVTFGSVGFNTFADVERTQRDASFTLTGLDHTGSDEWEPLAAIRHDPDETNVVVEWSSIEATTTPGNDDVVAVQTVNSDLVTVDWTDPFDDGSTVSPRAPPSLADYNSPLQYSEAITEVPAHDGTTTTTSPYSVSRLGGYQISHASSSGQNINAQRASGTRRLRNLNDPDVAVVFGKTATAGDFILDCGIQADY